MRGFLIELLTSKFKPLPTCCARNRKAAAETSGCFGWLTVDLLTGSDHRWHLGALSATTKQKVLWGLVGIADAVFGGMYKKPRGNHEVEVFSESYFPGHTHYLSPVLVYER